MLTIYHLGDSQSERIVWLCEELGLRYDLLRFERDSRGAAPPAYKALHPAGTAPVVRDGDLVLAETGAIVEYVAARHGGGRLLVGPDGDGFAEFLFWFHYANGSMVPALMMDSVAARLGAARLGTRTDVALALAEARLGEARWFAGDAFTAADIMMTFPLTRAASASADPAAMPNVARYLGRVRERPACRAAMARAEPGSTA